MSGEVFYAAAAERDLRRIEAQRALLIIRRVRWLAEHVDIVEHRALRGAAEGDFRMRVGDYRVIYNLTSERKVEVVAVGHRRDIYR